MAEEFERLESQGRQAIANLQQLKERVADGAEVLRQLKAAQARLNGVVDDITLLVEDARALSVNLPDEGDIKSPYELPAVALPEKTDLRGHFLSWLIDRSIQFFRDAAQAPTSLMTEGSSETRVFTRQPLATPEPATQPEPQLTPPATNTSQEYSRQSLGSEQKIDARAQTPPPPPPPPPPRATTPPIGELGSKPVSLCQKEVNEVLTAPPTVSRITTEPSDGQISRATTPMESSFGGLQIAARDGAACGIFTAKSFENKRPSTKVNGANVKWLLSYIYSRAPLLTSIHLTVGTFRGAPACDAGSIVCVEEVILYRDNTMRAFSKDAQSSPASKRHPACAVYQESQTIHNSFIVSDGNPEINVTDDPTNAFYGFLASNYMIIFRASEAKAGRVELGFDRDETPVYFDSQVLTTLRSFLEENLRMSFIEFSEEDNYRYSLMSHPRPKSSLTNEPISAQAGKDSANLRPTMRDSRFAFCVKPKSSSVVESSRPAVHSTCSQIQ